MSRFSWRLLPLCALVSSACPTIPDDDSATLAASQGVVVEVVGSDDARIRVESPAGLELDWTIVEAGTFQEVAGSTGAWEVRWEGGGLQGVEHPTVPTGVFVEVLVDTDGR